MRRLKAFVLILLPLALSGCGMIVLNPPGKVAALDGRLLIVTTILMLIIVVPVIVAIIWVAWRYRESNTGVGYAPEWEHSTLLELLMWGVPLVLIIAIGTVTWMGTHTLDQYRPVTQGKIGQSLQSNAKTLTVDVVSLRWKWLFFYPKYGVATVNEAAIPANVPIQFNLTSQDMMDAFYIPAFAGMIYVMPGMRTQEHGIIDKVGEYQGKSANFSGKGFTHMRFKFFVKSKDDFKNWIASVRSKGKTLSKTHYRKLAQPSINAPVQYYSSYQPGLFNSILNRCAFPGKMCMSKMMQIDAAGGKALPGESG